MPVTIPFQITTLQEARLMTPKDQAKSRIRDVKQRGNGLLSALKTAKSIQWMRERGTKWADDAATVLEEVFDDSKVADEFRKYRWEFYAYFVKEKDSVATNKRLVIQAMSRHTLILELIEDYIDNTSQSDEVPLMDVAGREVFLVHGHDEGPKHAVARFIETKLKLKPLILDELADQGMTIIEKLEYYAASAGYAVVILTPDDIGIVAGNRDEEKERARQNVILELGYFLGKIGRKRICILRKGDVEIPSDFNGVLYVNLDSSNGWQNRLSDELKQIGLI